MFKWLAAPGPKPRLSAEQIARKFPRLRFQVFMGIFLGYAGFYLIRNNISTVAPLLLEENGTIDKPAIGIIGNAVLISYGLSSSSPRWWRIVPTPATSSRSAWRCPRS